MIFFSCEVVCCFTTVSAKDKQKPSCGEGFTKLEVILG